MIFLFHSVGAPELPKFFHGKLWILMRNPREKKFDTPTDNTATDVRRKVVLGITFHGKFVGSYSLGSVSNNLPLEG